MRTRNDELSIVNLASDCLCVKRAKSAWC